MKSPLLLIVVFTVCTVYDRWLLLIKMYDKQNRIRGNQIPVDLLLPVLDNMMNKIYQRYWLYCSTYGTLYINWCTWLEG